MLCFPLKYRTFQQIRLSSKSPTGSLLPARGAGFLCNSRRFWAITPTTGSVGCSELPRRQPREVFDMNHCDFHYSHLLPKKPGILPLEETMTKKCRRCGAEFITRSRIRKRCDTCQTVVSAEKQKKANERLTARRAARRLCLLKAS